MYRVKNNRALLNLWGPLTKVIEDQQLTRASSHMKEKMDKFRKLRKALAIAVPEAKKGLNDDGLNADIKNIEQGLSQDYKNPKINLQKYCLRIRRS
jgi:hypothetical protein